MVLAHKTQADILALNHRISEILKNKERTVQGAREDYDKQAKRIWREIQKEIQNLAESERFIDNHVASMEFSALGRIIVTYHRRSSEELKSYDVQKCMDVNRIFIRIAILAEEVGFSIAPSQQLGSRGRMSWWIRFVDTKGNF